VDKSPGYVVALDSRHTICSGARGTTSCVVFLQHYYMRRPGSSIAHSEAPALSAGIDISKGVTPPFKEGTPRILANKD